MKKVIDRLEFLGLIENPKNAFKFDVDAYSKGGKQESTKLTCKLDTTGHFISFNYNTLKTITDRELYAIIENYNTFVISEYTTVEQMIRGRMRLVDQFIHSELDIIINSSRYTNLGNGSVMVDYDVDQQEPVSEVCHRAMDLQLNVVGEYR